jgi:hypothetical protein
VDAVLGGCSTAIGQFVSCWHLPFLVPDEFCIIFTRSGPLPMAIGCGELASRQLVAGCARFRGQKRGPVKLLRY